MYWLTAIKKTLKSHEYGVGILNITQEDNSILFKFEIPGFDIVYLNIKQKVKNI